MRKKGFATLSSLHFMYAKCNLLSMPSGSLESRFLETPHARMGYSSHTCSICEIFGQQAEYCPGSWAWGWAFVEMSSCPGPVHSGGPMDPRLPWPAQGYTGRAGLKQEEAGRFCLLETLVGNKGSVFNDFPSFFLNNRQKIHTSTMLAGRSYSWHCLS